MTERVLTLTLKHEAESGWTFHISEAGRPGLSGDDYLSPGQLCDDLRHELFPILKSLSAATRKASGGSKIALLALGLAALSSSACSSFPTAPCDVPGLTIHAIPADKIDNYCLAMLGGNDLNDAGAMVAPGEVTDGCAKNKPPEIAASSWRVMKHELRHLFAWRCGTPEP